MFYNFDIRNTIVLIRFFFFETSFSFRNRKALKAFIPGIFKSYQQPLVGLNYIFCSDEYLLTINRQFLQHDSYTDIITFNMAEPGEPVMGEIYISVDRVKENAKALQTPFQEELHRVIFHGALHLCGLKDKTDKDVRQMRQAETNFIVKWLNNVPRGKN